MNLFLLEKGKTLKISEIEKQILKESEEVSIQNILKEFRLLTNDLEHLLYPSLLESEGEDDEKFETRVPN